MSEHRIHNNIDSKKNPNVLITTKSEWNFCDQAAYKCPHILDSIVNDKYIPLNSLLISSTMSTFNAGSYTWRWNKALRQLNLWKLVVQEIRTHTNEIVPFFKFSLLLFFSFFVAVIFKYKCYNGGFFTFKIKNRIKQRQSVSQLKNVCGV